MSAICLGQLDAILSDAITRWNIPGASLAVLHGGDIMTAVAGVCDINSGDSVTHDTLFPYGSVSKVLTATIVLRLVQERKVDLDEPITSYVPEFKPGEPDLIKEISVRRLLSHSCGLVGTIFKDTGWGDDALAKNVELINAHPQYYFPGKLLSYCNSGILLLGRLIEYVTGQSWHQAFQTTLAQPLGIDTLVTRPEFALRHRFSVGHVRNAEMNQWQVAPHPFAFASHSPAGSTPGGRAQDLLTIVQLYLGIGEHTGFLGDDIIAEAWCMQCKSPVTFLQAGWGLGWSLFDWEDQVRIVGHDGSTMGTTAFLRIHPEKKIAVALLVNTTNGLLVYDQVFPEIFRTITGTWEPGIPESPPGFTPEVGRYEGIFESLTGQLELKSNAGKLLLYAKPNSQNQMPGSRFGNAVLHNYDEDAFYTVGEVSKSLIQIGNEETKLIRPYCISRLDSGDEYFHNGSMAFKRIA